MKFRPSATPRPPSFTENSRFWVGKSGNLLQYLADVKFSAYMQEFCLMKAREPSPLPERCSRLQRYLEKDVRKLDELRALVQFTMSQADDNLEDIILLKLRPALLDLRKLSRICSIVCNDGRASLPPGSLFQRYRINLRTKKKMRYWSVI